MNDTRSKERPPEEGEPVAGAAPTASLKDFLNSRRVPADSAFYFFGLGCVFVCICRFPSYVTGWEGISLLLFTAGLISCLVWACTAPASYARWREPVVSAVRVLRWTLPFCRHALLQVIGGNPWRHGTGLTGHLLFLPALAAGSGAALLLHGALACPLSLPWQAATLAAELAVTLPRVGEFCATEAMQHRQAQAVVHAASQGLSWVLSPEWLGLHAGSNTAGAVQTPGAAAGPQAGGREAGCCECCAVIAMAQLCCGFLLPVLLHAVREAAEFRTFLRLHRGRPQQHDWCYQLYLHTAALPEGVFVLWFQRVQLAVLVYALLSLTWSLVVSISAC